MRQAGLDRDAASNYSTTPARDGVFHSVGSEINVTLKWQRYTP